MHWRSILTCWKQACFYSRIKCVLCLCDWRPSSKLEKRSLALMSKPLSLSSETAAQSTWGKVCMPGSALQRRQYHLRVQCDVTDRTCLDLFQCLMHTWRWLAMRWRRALREKHLEVWRTSCWPWVCKEACFLIVRPLIRLYNGFYTVDFSFFLPILKWSAPGAFQLILLRPCTTQWRWTAIPISSAAILGVKLIERVKSPGCRVQELMTTPWSEWWSAAVRWTCWTSGPLSEGCLPVLFIPWSRYLQKQ